MQIQNTAKPQQSQTPQLRYASLHRTIDRGMGSDDVWSELSRACVALGFNDEAVKAYRKVETPHMCRSLGVLLARHGLISGSEPPARSSGSSHAPSSSRYAAVEDHPEPGFRQLVTDPFQFLFLDHMPLTVIVATLTFPLVVGLGGFLTADSHFLLFSAITLLPGLSVLGIVGALGRRIMVQAGQGIYYPPPVPDVHILCREAPRFLVDVLVLCLILLGPGTTTLLLLPGHLIPGVDSLVLGMFLMPAVGSLLLGMFLMPMALLMSEFSDDSRALSPIRLLSAVSRGGYEYLRTALVISALFLPAVLSALATMESHFYLQVSVIGPLIVVPLFVSCRLLGKYFHDQRSELQDLIRDVEPVVSPVFADKEPPPVPRPERSPETHLAPARSVARSRPPRQPLRAPSHPEARAPKPVVRSGHFESNARRATSAPR